MTIYRISERKRQAIIADYHAGASDRELLQRHGIDRQRARKLAKRRGEATMTELRNARAWERSRRMADEYDAERDMTASIEECYRVVRERVAAGGEPWRPGRE